MVKFKFNVFKTIKVQQVQTYSRNLISIGLGTRNYTNPTELTIDQFITQQVTKSRTPKLKANPFIEPIINKLNYGIIPTTEDVRSSLHDILVNNEADEFSRINCIKELTSILLKLETKSANLLKDLIQQLEADSTSMLASLSLIYKSDPELSQNISNQLFNRFVEKGNLNLSISLYSFIVENGNLESLTAFKIFLSYLQLDINSQPYLIHFRNIYDINMVLKQLEDNDNGRFLEILNSMLVLNLNLNIVDVNYILKPLVKVNPDLALKFYKSNSFNLNKSTLILIRGLLVYHNKEELVNELLSDMQTDLTNGYKSKIFDMMLLAYFQNKQFDAAYSYFQKEIASHPNLITKSCLTIVLQQFNKMKHVERDFDGFKNNMFFVYDLISKNDVQIDGMLVNLLIQNFLKVDQPFALKLFQYRLTALKHIPLDRYTFAIIVCHLLKPPNLDIDLALEYFYLSIDTYKLMPNNEMVSLLLTRLKRFRLTEDIVVVKDKLNLIGYLPNLDDHIDRYLQQVTNNEGPINEGRKTGKWKLVRTRFRRFKNENVH